MFKWCPKQIIHTTRNHKLNNKIVLLTKSAIIRRKSHFWDILANFIFFYFIYKWLNIIFCNFWQVFSFNLYHNFKNCNMVNNSINNNELLIKYFITILN